MTYLPVTPSVLPGQHLPLPHAIHYTTDDGLPSTEVYCVLEDRRGYMWFGTDNGVVRFDGYSFKTYGPQQGLRDPVVFSLQEDKDGLIYACSGFSSKVFVWSSHTDLFSPHMVNIDSSLANAYPDLITKLVSVGSEDSLLFSTSHYGPLTYTPQKGVHYSSEILQLPDSISLHDRISVFAQNPTNLVTFFRTKRSLNDTVVNKWYDLDVPTDMYFFDTKGSILHRQRLPKLRSKSSYALFSFLHLANEDSIYVTVHKNKDIILESEQFSRKLPVPSSYFHPNFHFRLPDGDFLLGGSQGNGLVYYQSLEDFTNGRGLKILDNCNASFATLDHKGGLWVTTLDKGVFYYPVRSIKVYNEKQLLPASKNISLIDLGGDSLILGYETNEICIIQIPSNDSLRIEDKLTASFQPGVFFIDAPRNAVYTKRTQIQLNTLTQPKLVRLGGYGNIRLRPY
ncbi:MAG: two-component regulator propeller domain-containing protein, partial [Bacteroidota bacterium]